MFKLQEFLELAITISISQGMVKTLDINELKKTRDKISLLDEFVEHAARVLRNEVSTREYTEHNKQYFDEVKLKLNKLT